MHRLKAGLRSSRLWILPIQPVQSLTCFPYSHCHISRSTYYIGFFDQKHVDEMLKESKTMCNLDHPNVQTLIGVCIDGGPTPYIVMPFMENGSLLSFLRKNKDTLLLKQGEEHEVWF